MALQNMQSPLSNLHFHLSGMSLLSQIVRFSLGPNDGGSKRGRDGSRGGRDSS